MLRKEPLDFLWALAARVASKSVKLQGPARARNDQPVIDCVNGYQRENREEAGESKRSAGKKVAPMKKAAKKNLAKKRITPKKKLKTKVGGKKTTGGKTGGPFKKQVRGKSRSVDTVAFASEGLGGRSGEQSGDLQGLSNVQGADSESVDELLEEGNAFEADVVKGVEDAGDTDEREIRTHEVPQDDVPGEYLDKK